MPGQKEEYSLATLYLVICALVVGGLVYAGVLGTAVQAIIVLGFLIFFHELGHFLAARSLKIGVSTFSLGFGPKLWKKTWGKTEYCLSLIPLGGYVALVGDSEDAQLPEGFTAEESFSLRPAWHRLLVVAAGPFANFLLAWFICWGLAFAYGQTTLLPEIGTVMEDSAAQSAGMKEGDMVLSINGKPVPEWTDLSDSVEASKGAPLTFVVLRNGDNVSLEITPKAAMRKTIFGDEKASWLVGVRPTGKVRTEELGFMSAASVGAVRTWEMVSLTWQGLVKLVQRAVPADQVGGPIMIAQLVGQQAEAGFSALLALVALISINLAVLNLLPVPVLDGGHIVFCLIEMVTRRPLNERFRAITMQIGFFLLISLMLLATFNDVWRIIRGTGS